MKNLMSNQIIKDLGKNLLAIKNKLTKEIIIFLTLTIILETCAQTFLKRSTESKDNKKKFILAGCLFYSLVGYSYYYLLSSDIELTFANNLWNIGTTITIMMAGILFFQEKLNVKRLIGLILTVIGVSLIG